jgi:hypothetical protein
VANDDIELSVRSGMRVPELEVDANDTILVTLNGLVNACVVAAADRRPSMAAVNTKIANFIRDLIAL